MNKPDLVVLVAIWEFVTASGAFVGTLCIVAIAMRSVVLSEDPFVVVPLVVLSVPMVLLLCYAALAVAGGVGLLLGREWGRITSIVHAGVSLLWLPIGTAIGVLALIYLTKAEIREYFQVRGSQGPPA